jgi:hypothetical protein
VTYEFSQSLASAGRPPHISSYDGPAADGKLMRETLETCTERLTPPYRSQNMKTEARAWFDGRMRSTATVRDFDVYGNVVLLKEFGQAGVLGDERSTPPARARHLTPLHHGVHQR